MPFISELQCPKCDNSYTIQNWSQDKCGYRLRIIYDTESRNDIISKEQFINKEISHWKYWDFFPVENRQNQVTIGEGGTRLIKSEWIAKDLGIKNLYFKLELSNPTGSFKDRPISIGVSMAKETGAEVVSAASSGNAAASLASLGAKAGLKVVVFVPERASSAKVAQLSTLGAYVVRVSGDEDSEGDPSAKLFRDAIEKWKWLPSPSFGPFNPFQFEGTKSLAFEIIEQLNWETPDWVLCNTGSGGLIGGTTSGFLDWYDLDWIESIPKMVAVQPESCSPVVKSFEKRVNPLEFQDEIGFPSTVAGGLADPHPWDGDTALEMIYTSKGSAISVNDAEILDALKTMASKEGIFASPSGVAAVAALRKMVDQGTIDTYDKIVIPITGHGLKDPSAVKQDISRVILTPPNLEKLSKLITF